MMIKIVVNDIVLDLPEGLKLERKRDTNIFKRELEAEDFTYPVDLPLTDNNKKALGNIHLLANTTINKDFDAELFISGDYRRVVLTVLSMNMAEHTISISLFGDYGGFWKDADGIYVNELELGGIRTIGALDTGSVSSEIIDPNSGNIIVTYTPNTANDHINDIIDGNIVTDYVFYPAVDEKINLERIHEEQEFESPGSESTTGIRSLINPVFYNNAGDRGIIDPVKAYLETTFKHSERPSNDRYFWVPFFRLSFVLQKCFTELGYHVSGDILNDAKFNAVTLYNTYCINQCRVTESNFGSFGLQIFVFHECNTIDPRNHVPNMSVTYFLREIGKAFNLQYNIDYTRRKVIIDQVGSIDVNNNNVVDITNRANPLPTVNYDDLNVLTRYDLNFNTDDENGASNENTVSDQESISINYLAAHYGVLNAIPSPADLSIGFVQSENRYYQYIDSNWLPYGYPSEKYKSSDDDNYSIVKLDVNPMPVKRFDKLCRMQFPNDPFFNTLTYAYDYDFMLPYSALGISGKNLLAIKRWPGNSTPNSSARGIYLNRVTVVSYVKKSKFIYLCNYLGKGSIDLLSAKVFPMGNSVPYDAQGALLNGYNLCWNNEFTKGLFPQFWEPFTKRATNQVKVEYELLWDAVLELELNLNTSIIRINNVLYLCEGASLIMPYPHVCKLNLIRYG